MSSEKKFIESYDIEDFEVKTDTGWEDIKKLHKTMPYTVYEVELENNYKLRAADNHILFDSNLNELYLKDANNETLISTDIGSSRVRNVDKLDYKENMYDLELSDSSNKRYYTNGILSHNTTTYTILALHEAVFTPDTKILICANKFATALEIMNRIRLAYELLPNWLKCGVKSYNKGSIEFSNGSVIEGIATSSDSARGKSCKILIIDEASFVAPGIMSSFWTSVYPIVSSSKESKVIMVSTPNGIGNLFYETYESARLNVDSNGWKSFRFDWWDVPGRDEKWKQQQINSFQGNMIRFNQEFNNCFEGSSYTLIKSEDILKFKNFIISDKWFEPNKIEIPNTEFSYNQWFKPEKDKVYIVSADVSDGVGQDSSVALVFDITNGRNKMTQVASFSSNVCSTIVFPYILTRIATEYNNAYLAIEANNMGRSVLDSVQTIYEYENIITYNDQVSGIKCSAQTKAEACMWLRDLLNDINIDLYDKHLVAEMEYFERKVGKFNIYAAVNTKHDDYMMAFLWSMLCLKEEIIENYYVVDNYYTNKVGINIPNKISSETSDYYSGESSSYNTNNNHDVSELDELYKKVSSGKSPIENEDDVDLPDDYDSTTVMDRENTGLNDIFSIFGRDTDEL